MTAPNGTPEPPVPATPVECRPSKRADKKHGWRFDGDDPRIVCDFCGEMRDALTGRVIQRRGVPQPPVPATEAPAGAMWDALEAAVYDEPASGPWLVEFVRRLRREREARAAQQEQITRITALRDELAKDDGVFTSDYFARRLSALLAPPAPARDTNDETNDETNDQRDRALHEVQRRIRAAIADTEAVRRIGLRDALLIVNDVLLARNTDPGDTEP